MLFLPDGDEFLEPVDAFERGFEGRAGDGARSQSQRRWFRRPAYGPAGAPWRRGRLRGSRDLRADLRHHLERHGFVTFVIQIERGPPLVLLRTVPSKVTTAPSAPVRMRAMTRVDVDGVPGKSEVMAGVDDFAGVGAARHPKRAAGMPLRRPPPGSWKALQTPDSAPSQCCGRARAGAGNGRRNDRRLPADRRPREIGVLRRTPHNVLQACRKTVLARAW